MPRADSEQRGISGVSYDDVPESYFEARGLRRYAGVGSLWALGVGAVISGDFFGWNFWGRHRLVKAPEEDFALRAASRPARSEAEPSEHRSGAW